jgi:hypothetical protein
MLLTGCLIQSIYLQANRSNNQPFANRGNPSEREYPIFHRYDSNDFGSLPENSVCVAIPIMIEIKAAQKNPVILFLFIVESFSREKT